MGLINFKDLNLSKSKELITFTFNEQEILVKKYLSTEEIYDLLMTTLEKSEENGIYNAYKLDMYFHLNLVYLYSNIVFDLEDRADEPTIYDKLLQSGLLNEVLSRINKDDYLNYQEWLTKIAEDRLAQQGSFVEVVEKIFNQIPDALAALPEILKELELSDNEQVQEAVKIIKENTPVKLSITK